MNIEEVKNNLREFQVKIGRKFKYTQAELKKSCLLYKNCMLPEFPLVHYHIRISMYLSIYPYI